MKTCFAAHLQALLQAGLAVLESSKEIWSTCHQTREEVIEKSEMAASAAMLAQNFTIDRANLKLSSVTSL